jgi:hypothetical protein
MSVVQFKGHFLLSFEGDGMDDFTISVSFDNWTPERIAEVLSKRRLKSVELRHTVTKETPEVMQRWTIK